MNGNYKLIHGDMLEELDKLLECSIDCIITDPPYELGFMCKSWDSAGVSFQRETWEKCFRVLKPGGYLLSFGGTRTYHRIACAIEDAGFEIRDTIMWLYGSGFPKSMNIGLAIDKKNGVESEVIGYADESMPDFQDAGKKNSINKIGMNDGESADRKSYPIYKAKNEWSGWGTCLKPAYEPIIVARKPFDGSLIDNVLENGVGGLNIDECRISHSEEAKFTNRNSKAGTVFNTETCGIVNENNHMASPSLDGRFPANVVLTYDEATRDEVCGGMPDSKGASSQNNYSNGHIYRGQSLQESSTTLSGYREWYNDSGSASRYFYNAEVTERDAEGGRFPANVILTYDDADYDEVCGDMPVGGQNGSISKPYKINNQVYGEYGYCKPWDAYEDRGSASRYFYCAKASKRDRDAGLDEFENTRKAGYGYDRGYGNAGEGMFQYRMTMKRNTHPTVKPTALMQYLVRLVAPRGATILDPFMGSGSTGKAVAYENFDRNADYKFIGVELNAEYIDIARARIEYVVKNPLPIDTKTVTKTQNSTTKVHKLFSIGESHE